MWRLLILLSLIIQPAIALAETTNSSEQRTVKLLNSGTDYLADLKTAGILSADGNNWTLSDIQLILMGNALDPNKDIAPQISELKRIETLASDNNSQFRVLLGNSEYMISSREGISSAVGEWLAGLSSTIQIGEHMISHRGLSLKQFEDKKIKLDMAIHHPANYMGSQICHPYFETDRLRKTLNKVSAKTLWVAQAQDFVTPWQKRLSNQLHILNKGVIATIGSGRATVSLVDGTDVLLAEKSPDRYPANPVGMSDQEIIEILTNGEVIGEEAIPVGITKPMKLTLSYNGKQIDAAFKTLDDARNNQKGKWDPRERYTDRYLHEIAAFKLDRKLNIGLVPATIVRQIGRERGSLQVWYDNLMSKLSYKEDGLEYAGHCDQKSQRNMMRVFDYLIMNEDRNQSNILQNKHDWQFWYIDHSRSFADITRRTEQMRKNSDIYVTPEFGKELEAMDRDQMKSLRPYLHQRRIASMDRRRKHLLSGKVNDL